MLGAFALKVIKRRSTRAISPVTPPPRSETPPRPTPPPPRPGWRRETRIRFIAKADIDGRNDSMQPLILGYAELQKSNIP